MGIRDKSVRAVSMVAATVVPRNRKTGWILIALLETAILGTSALVLVREARTADGRMRGEMLNWVQAASLAIDAGEIGALTGDPSDEALPAYAAARSALENIRRTRDDIRFSYLLTIRDGVPMFLADSEPPGTPAASRPGDPYPDASPELVEALFGQTAFVEGPVSDQWGVWVSGFSPIPCSAASVGPVLLGVDISAATWRRTLMEHVFLIAVTFFSINLVILGFVVALVLAGRRADRMAYSEQRFKSIAESVSDWVWAADGQGRITFSSGQAMPLWGCAPEKMLGRSITDILPFEDSGGWPDALLFDWDGSGKGGIRCAIQGDGGDSRTLFVRGQPLQDITGRIIGWQGTVTDVTDSARAEESLRKRDKILNGAANASSALITLSSGNPVSGALRILGNAVGVDRAYIFEHVQDPVTGALLINHRYEWTAEGVSQQLDNPLFQSFPFDPDFTRWRELLLARRPVRGLVRKFPESERLILQAQGIQSILVMPIILHGEVWGFLGLDDCQREREWASYEEDILAAVAASFGAAIERRRMEDALRLFESAFHHASDSIVITTAELDRPGPRILYVNPAFTLMSGYLEEDVIGGTPRMFQGPQTPPEFRMALRQTLSCGEVFEGETINYRKDGEPYIVEVNISPVSDFEGRITHFVAIQRNVTAKRAIESALRQKTMLLGAISTAQSGFIVTGMLRENLSRLLEDLLLITASGCGFIGEFVFDESGKARLCLHAAKDAMGDENAPELSGNDPSAIIACEDMGALCGAVISSGEPYFSNNPEAAPRGNIFPCGHAGPASFLGLPFLIGGEVAGVVGIANRPEGYGEEMAAQLEPFTTTCASLIGAHRGEARRRAAEDALRESEERARTVLNTIVDGIITVNETGMVEMANPAAARMFGYRGEDMAGCGVDTLMPELRDWKLGNGIPHHPGSEHSNGGGAARRAAAVRSDGSRFTVELSMNQSATPDGRLFTISIRDITWRLRAEAQLSEAKAREQATRNRIQETLLFGQPPTTLQGVSVGMATLPSQQMDGDFFDFFELAPGTMDILVGDIMGKGTTAALLGAATKNHFLRAINILNSELCGRIPCPADILNKVHEAVTPQLMRPGIEVFATLFYARFDFFQRSCVFVDCGHTKTIHWHENDGTCSELAGENLPLGILREETYAEHRVSYAPGDVFVLYSDGITEARDDSGNYFGVEGITSALARCRCRDSKEIVAELMKTVSDYAGDKGFSDDATCLVVKAAPLRTLEETLPASLGELSGLRGLLRGLFPAVSDSPPPEDSVVKAELGLVEAFTNIVRHVYNGSGDFGVLVRMELFPHGVCLRLEHDGPFFAPANVSAPAVEELPESGYGLFLISQCFETVDYFVTANGRSAVVLASHFGLEHGGPSYENHF